MLDYLGQVGPLDLLLAPPLEHLDVDVRLLRVGVTARRDAKLPPHSICMPSSMRNHVQTMNLRFRTAFLMTGAIPFETEIQTSSTTHMSAAFAGSPV